MITPKTIQVILVINVLDTSANYLLRPFVLLLPYKFSFQNSLSFEMRKLALQVTISSKPPPVKPHGQFSFFAAGTFFS